MQRVCGHRPPSDEAARGVSNQIELAFTKKSSDFAKSRGSTRCTDRGTVYPPWARRESGRRERRDLHDAIPVVGGRQMPRRKDDDQDHLEPHGDNCRDDGRHHMAQHNRLRGKPLAGEDIDSQSGQPRDAAVVRCCRQGGGRAAAPTDLSKRNSGPSDQSGGAKFGRRGGGSGLAAQPLGAVSIPPADGIGGGRPAAHQQEKQAHGPVLCCLFPEKPPGWPLALGAVTPIPEQQPPPLRPEKQQPHPPPPAT